MTSHLLSEHSYFWGGRGHFELRGAFKAEPNWQRLARRERGLLLRDVRCCHLPPHIQSPRDWAGLGGEIVFEPAFPGPSAGGAEPPPTAVATGPEIYGLDTVLATGRAVLNTFLNLPLDREQHLLQFVRQWGLPTVLRKHAVVDPDDSIPDMSPYCPVVRLQYDVAVLRNLMRLASELRRPMPDRFAVNRLTKVLQAQWQDPRGAWPAVGDEDDSDYPNPSDWWPLCSDTRFPPYELEVTPLNLEHPRRVDSTAHVMRGTNALKVGFARVLANCSPSVDVRYERATGYRLWPRFLFRCEETRLRDFIYLQAWESLADRWLGECACGCGTLFMLTSQQRRAWLEGRRVFVPNHRDRGRRRSLQSPEEADRQRKAHRERKARQRQATRDVAVAEGRPRRGKGRPRKAR